ncbi:MAG: aminotransferase class V-fold PLP-dependent enzyme [Saprospiraceae bacterium]|nr:aminotransferase class V-fold PLP-dependent enzyme [Saprospiraceae bacterium]
MIDINKVRFDTPGCQDKIFLNSAGSSLVPNIVSDTMYQYLEQERMIGGYQTALIQQDKIDEFYIQSSLLLNCEPKNIAFSYNATDAYAKALSSINFRSGDVILTSDDDYISNYIAFFSLKKRFGIEIVRIKNLDNGDIDLIDAEEKMVTCKPILVSITHVPTNSGKIQPVEKIGELCATYDIWYIVDACQSVGQIIVDVKKIKCDFLSATGRKFLRGPRGTGLLYISDKALNAGLEPLMIDMRGAKWNSEQSYSPIDTARRFELWEVSYSNLMGLTEAIKYANQIGLGNIQSANLKLINLLKSTLIQNIDIHLTEEGSRSASIVTFSSRSKPLEYFVQKLNDANVSYGVGYREFALIDFNKKDVDWVIRLSPHYFNTEQEIMNTVEVLAPV